MTGRAAMLCSVAALGITFLLSPIRSRLEKPILILVIAVVVLLVTGGYSSLAIDMGHSRQISPEQLVTNIMSIFGEGDNSAGGLEQTKQWRLRWWDTIINYTFNGPYFWTGKGYGINLANSDGFQVFEDDLLRSPHNAALTILARSGVPGFGLWAIFMVGYMLFLLRIALFERRSRPKQVAIAIWLLAYMAAFHIMAFFDVFLEGPMGGAWLWSLIGMSFVYFGRHKDEELANMVTTERAS
jgi:O-antigen ligase